MHKDLSENNSKDVSESEHNIVNKTLLENIYKHVSQSERNIVNTNLLQKNFAYIPENTITELKDEEHKEPLVTQKITGYFNIFEFGRNLLDQLDVTYKPAFMATPVEDEYYKDMMRSLIKANNESGKVCNEKIRQSVIDLRAEMNV